MIIDYIIFYHQTNYLLSLFLTQLQDFDLLIILIRKLTRPYCFTDTSTKIKIKLQRSCLLFGKLLKKKKNHTIFNTKTLILANIIRQRKKPLFFKPSNFPGKLDLSYKKKLSSQTFPKFPLNFPRDFQM